MSLASPYNRRRNLTCQICGRTFDSQEMLDIHNKIDHNVSDQTPAGVG
ncbi:MAG: hypothetical protein WB511_04995 [Nitrososphaeraceae archaeon]